jgi:CubicO group peptidase (beta-lactamase class C family)
METILVMTFFSSRLRSILCCILVLTVAASSTAAAAAQTAHANPLSGLWATEARFGVPAQGELTVDGREGVWRALLAGYQVAVQKKGGHLGFKLPGDAGEFRGYLNAAANVIRGQWIQPKGEILNQQYASPIELHSISPSIWRGTVVPLEQRISVYASIASSSDGKLTAFLSNPEMNFFRRRIFTVTRDGAKIHLDANGWTIEGTYDEKSDTLSLQLLDDSLPPFQFSRRKDKDAIGFYPRISADSSDYRYRKPLPDNDGWPTASLAEEGLDEGRITALIGQILTADPATNPIDIQSLLIARHGHLVLEEYFYGFDEERVHDMRSASKTFATVLVGMAKEHGAKLTSETPVYSLFSQYNSFENWDVRKQQMSLRDIMTMTAGNACDDNDDNSPGNEDKMQSDPKQHDWYKYTLDLAMLKHPGGEDAVYCSGDLNVVGGAVASATRTWLPQFFEQYLARPLQFGRYYLNLMPDGQAYMGGGSYLRPRDELKLGQLYLDGGVWNGKRILSKSWVEESTRSHSRFDPAYSLGQEHQYGYGWHINFLKSGGKTYRVFAAGGNGGQFVIVVPDLDLVVGINGGSYGEFNKWYRWELELVPQSILPAVTTRQ